MRQELNGYFLVAVIHVLSWVFVCNSDESIF